jgi:hypothetical protein
VAIGDMMKETFALINDQDQVVNHIVIDKDDANFESNMADQLSHWACVRYVETNVETDVIILDESPDIWTTHTEADGFVLPLTSVEVVDAEKPLIRKVSELPADSLLLEANAANRPEGWVFPSYITVIEG